MIDIFTDALFDCEFIEGQIVVESYEIRTIAKIGDDIHSFNQARAIACTDDEGIGPIASGEGINAGATVEGIVPLTAIQIVVAGTAIQSFGIAVIAIVGFIIICAMTV